MTKNIDFIDSRVASYQSLIDGLTEPAKVFILDGESDGLAQMAAQLQGRSGIDASTSSRMAARRRGIWTARCWIMAILHRMGFSLPVLGVR